MQQIFSLYFVSISFYSLFLLLFRGCCCRHVTFVDVTVTCWCVLVVVLFQLIALSAVVVIFIVITVCLMLLVSFGDAKLLNVNSSMYLIIV